LYIFGRNSAIYFPVDKNKKTDIVAIVYPPKIKLRWNPAAGECRAGVGARKEEVG